jgi:hypothetical protein
MTSSARQHKSAGVDLRADVCDQVPAIGSAESNLGVVVQHLYVRGAEPVRLTRIRVDGDTAIATYSNGDRPQLRKINGRWLIDSF